MKLDWFRAYVESLLRDMWDGHARADDDGDWPFRHGTAACWVSVRAHPRWRVEVFAHAASEVKQSARLLRELNEANSNLVDGRVYWRGGVVVVETSVEAEQVDARSLFRACMAVGSAADDLGGLLAAMFDGSTPFPAEVGA
jgi:Putative bacterial sensory transduction regulator